MKHVNAYPFVGKDYEKGFLNSGKKVLILGIATMMLIVQVVLAIIVLL